MSQPIPAEAVGAVAEHTNTNQDDATDTLQKVLTNMNALSADPTRDQSPLGGAGSGQEGQVPGLEHPQVNQPNRPVLLTFPPFTFRNNLAQHH